MSQRYKDVIHTAVRQLTAAEIDNARFDADLLAEAAFGFTKTDLLLKADDVAPPAQIITYYSYIQRRAAHEPAHRILGWREFWGLRFVLSPDTLEPRPDSETLLETVRHYFPDTAQNLRAIDFGTGTGCLVVSFLHDYQNATGIGVDAAPGAAKTAHANARANNVDKRCTILIGDWGADLVEPAEIIFANPPYIEQSSLAQLDHAVKDYDPLLALDGGPDGLAAYRALLPDVARLLAEGGYAFIEIGSEQAASVTTIAQQNGLFIAKIVPDLAGLPRCLVMAKK